MRKSSGVNIISFSRQIASALYLCRKFERDVGKGLKRRVVEGRSVYRNSEETSLKAGSIDLPANNQCGVLIANPGKREISRGKYLGGVFKFPVFKVPPVFLFFYDSF